PRSSMPFGARPASSPAYGERDRDPYGDAPLGDGGPGSAPRSGTPYGGPSDYRAGVRRRDDDEPPAGGGGRRRAGTDYDESLSPDSWRRDAGAGPAWQSRALG